MTSIDERLKTKSAFPFKRVKGEKGRLKFRQTKRRPGTKIGSALEIEHNGHDHVSLIFRELYETNSGKQGDRCYNRWTLDARDSVALASVLFYMAEEHQRDSAEVPYSRIVDKERASFGPNWINEDYDSAIARTEKRKDRSHLFGLMKRCIETCDDEEFMQFLTVQLALWADASSDEFAIQQAEKSFAQLGMIPPDHVN